MHPDMKLVVQAYLYGGSRKDGLDHKYLPETRSAVD